MAQAAQHYDRGLDLFGQQKFEESLAEFTRALELEPKNPDFLEAAGVLLGRLGRFDDAIAKMNELIAVAPETIMAYTNLSQIYVQKGLIKEAEAAQSKARMIGWKQELRRKKQLQKEEEIEAAAREKMLEQTRARVERFLPMLDEDPDNEIIRFSLGNGFMELGQFGRAAEQFEEVLRIKPDYSAAYLNLGECMVKLDRTLRAIDLFTRGIAIADEKGELAPKKKMEAALNEIRSPRESTGGSEKIVINPS